MYIAVINYNMGNIKSVANAFISLGISIEVTHDPEVIINASGVVLPGVGAFRDAITSLRSDGLDQVIRDSHDKGAYIVGICLGMQLLYEWSYENGSYQGLGLIPGEIVKLVKMPKIPHMGWNDLTLVGEDPLTKYLQDGDYVYFVHSYYASSSGEEILACTHYGERIPAIVRRGNTIGFQFHPEKSGAVGVRLLKALGEMIG